MYLLDHDDEGLGHTHLTACFRGGRSGGDCGRCGGSLQVLGECSSLSFDAAGGFSLTVSAHCTRGIATVSVDGPCTSSSSSVPWRLS